MIITKEMVGLSEQAKNVMLKKLGNIYTMMLMYFWREKEISSLLNKLQI